MEWNGIQEERGGGRGYDHVLFICLLCLLGVVYV